MCVTSIRELRWLKETSSLEKNQDPEKIGRSRLSHKIQTGAKLYFSIRDPGLRRADSQSWGNQVLHDGHSLWPQTSAAGIQLEQDVNTRHNTYMGAESKTHWGSWRQEAPKCPIAWVSREMDYKRGTRCRGGWFTIITNSCSITQKDLFSMPLTNHKNLAVLIK